MSPVVPKICRCGGIGRRGGLKNRWITSMPVRLRPSAPETIALKAAIQADLRAFSFLAAPRLPPGILSHKPFQRKFAVLSSPYLPGTPTTLEGCQEEYMPMMALAEATLELKYRWV